MQEVSAHSAVESRSRFSVGLRLVLAVALASTLTAGVVLLFSYMADRAYDLFLQWPALGAALPLASLATYGLYRALHVDFSTSTADVIEQVKSGKHVSTRLAPAIFAGTCLSVLGSASVGKEAAALQIGASVSSWIAGGMESGEASVRTRQLRRTISLAGMASAFSILLGAPVAAALFVCEISGAILGTAGIKLKHRHSCATDASPAPDASDLARAVEFVLILASAFWARIIAVSCGAHGLSGAVPTLGMSLGTFEHVLALVAVEAVVGCVFCIALAKGRAAFGKLPVSKPVVLLVGGVAWFSVVVGFGFTDITGTGMAQVSQALAGQVDTPLFAGKLLATVLLLSCGFKGGEIMPMLCIGSTLGCFAGGLLGMDPVFAAALGTAAFMTACTNCPLAALALALECFGVGNVAFYVPAIALAFVFTLPVSLYGNEWSPRRIASAAKRHVHMPFAPAALPETPSIRE